MAFENLNRAAQNGTLVLFIGSGLSSPPFDSWSAFVQKAIKAANLNATTRSGREPDEILQHCKQAMNPEDWLKFIDNCFSKKISIDEISANYKCLTRLNIRQIITTNYDSIPSILWPNREVFSNTKGEMETIIRRLALPDKYEYVLKLHGCHTRPDTLVVTSKDYRKVIRRKDIRIYLNSVLAGRTVLFLGFGLNDIHVGRILKHLRFIFGNNIPGAYAILPNATREDGINLKREYNIDTLSYESVGGNHDGLGKLLSEVFNITPPPPPPTKRYLDISELSIIAKAFPLESRTRVIYTCRGWFEKPPFVCPSKDNKLKDSRTAPTHMPVDELETAALCVAWYGREILGNLEKEVKNSMICSDDITFDHKGNDFDVPIDRGELDQILLDNLIVVGENRFSNRLFYFFCHHLPWRHLVSDVIEVDIFKQLTANHKFTVKAYFRDHFGNQISDRDSQDLKLDSRDLKLKERNYWGIITFVPNPFAPNKWILFLVGCHREGQYLLLSWLRDAAAIATLSEIIKFKKKDYRFFQIVVKGRLKGEPTEGNIHREWEFETVNDISSREKTSFFSNPFFQSDQKSKIGDDMTDLSLLALVPNENELIKQTKETLPDALKDLIEQEQLNGDVGLHVTLYEFLHRRDVKQEGFVRRLMDGQGGFLNELIETFKNAPQIHLRARQTRLTPYSLQVLVDIYIDMKKYFSSIDGWNKKILNAMDLIIEYCRMANRRLPIEQQHLVNVDRVPMPLHLTLLRFPPNATDQQRNKAKDWASQYERKIWGKIENLSIILTHASKFPFSDIRSMKIR